MYDPDDCLMISGLQHFRFCRRQWALIHIEQQWTENLRTTEGALLHERAHDEQLRESRGDTIITCDVVEFHRDERGVPLHGYEGTWLPYPVEYKRGHAKQDGCDELQLCAQAMCLEEMLCCEIPAGALFYGETRRRVPVPFSPELRQEVHTDAAQMHDLFHRGRTPRVKPTKSCNACSLTDLCLPRLTKTGSVQDYLRAGMEEPS
mgnify:CR=1 FL=1